MQVDQRRPARQDTYDLRGQLHSDDHSQGHGHYTEAVQYGSTDDEEHSVLEEDSEGEERDDMDYEQDDDGSSDLSIPNESIDFDLVYAFHSFAATVEGQANVVKGDSLFLMDDSNSYWWLVRVLKTQEVGYIPAENIETPFERLARLNKHRNVDLAQPTIAEKQENLSASQDRLRNNLASRNGGGHTPSPVPRNRSRQTKSITFTSVRSVHRYPPAVWNEEIEEDPDTEWDLEGYEDEDEDLAEEEQMAERQRLQMRQQAPTAESSDGMDWEEALPPQAAPKPPGAPVIAPAPAALNPTPLALRPGVAAPNEQAAQQQIAQQRAEQQRLQQQQQLQQQTQQGPPRSSSAQGQADPNSPSRQIDPATATETRKISVTPSVARVSLDEPRKGPAPPSVIMQQQQDEDRLKRIREEESDESLRKRAKAGKEKEKTGMAAAPVSSAAYQNQQKQGGKLRKERNGDNGSISTDEDGKDKKKKGGVFSIFSRKKNKGSVDETNRSSVDSDRARADGVMSPTTATAMEQQQRSAMSTLDSKKSSPGLTTPSTPPQVSHHASQLVGRDRELYQQYLNRSPSSPPEIQPSYGMQSAPVMSHIHYTSPSANSNTALTPPASRPRPGSLILSPGTMEGQAVPDLSVIRVFAGKNLQTEATFKTVLLNHSISAAELVRQSIQRFRLPAAEDEAEYYLTAKRVEGSSTVIQPDEKPLTVFEGLVEAAELPKVKRSSVGSISSIASNLSMHPAIKKLPMNDFSDDSVVKFYLNRKGDGNSSDSFEGYAGDETLMAVDNSMSSDVGLENQSTSSQGVADRFSSPSSRFGLQLLVHKEDLPEDMVFDPLTEAIVFKNTLKDRNQSGALNSPGLPQNYRRKVFVFPKNATVAEVIEVGLERFGIVEGVVDGGDEVEDKLSKRRSALRVRYGLSVLVNGSERDLPPSGRVLEAYPRPPTFRSADRKNQDSKRRSMDSTMLLGNSEDVGPDDPVFILRRAVSYKQISKRNSVGLDELALASLHRESMSSQGSSQNADEGKPKQPTKADIIAQRAAWKNNQRAIISAQTNNLSGTDVLLPGNARLRSERYDVNDRMRYSYVEADGESYDISDLVEEELQETGGKNDLFEGVLGRNKEVVGEKLGRVLSKIKTGRGAAAPGPVAQRQLKTHSMGSSRSASPSSQYSLDDNTVEGVSTRSRSVTPTAAPSVAQRIMPTVASRKIASQNVAGGRMSPAGSDRASTPTQIPQPPPNRRQPSVASVISDVTIPTAGYATPMSSMTRTPTPHGAGAGQSGRSLPALTPRHRELIEDDFGLSGMMAVIEYRGSKPKVQPRPMDPVDQLLFGRPLNLDALHPKVKEIYAPAAQQLEEIDKLLDDLILTI